MLRCSIASQIASIRRHCVSVPFYAIPTHSLAVLFYSMLLNSSLFRCVSLRFFAPHFPCSSIQLFSFLFMATPFRGYSLPVTSMLFPCVVCSALPFLTIPLPNSNSHIGNNEQPSTPPKLLLFPQSAGRLLNLSKILSCCSLQSSVYFFNRNLEPVG